MSEGLRRISVAEVRAAVEKTGLQLVPRVTCNRDGMGKPCGGCVMFVVAVAEGFAPIGPGYVFIKETAEHLGLDDDYADGLASGFDGIGFARSNLVCALGHADGCAIRAALLPQAVTA